jgi:hypothetical protein
VLALEAATSGRPDRRRMVSTLRVDPLLGVEPLLPGRLGSGDWVYLRGLSLEVFWTTVLTAFVAFFAITRANLGAGCVCLMGDDGDEDDGDDAEGYGSSHRQRLSCRLRQNGMRADGRALSAEIKWTKLLSKTFI